MDFAYSGFFKERNMQEGLLVKLFDGEKAKSLVVIEPIDKACG